jgi:hypothetical protein
LAVSLLFTFSFALGQPLEQWVARYNGPENLDYAPFALAVDPSRNVYVTGYSAGCGTDYDYATIKYSKQTAVETRTLDSDMPRNLSLACHSGSFNASSEIFYMLAEAGDVELTVCNLGGQLIQTLVHDYQEVGECRVVWDASDYSSGVCFYKLTTAGDFTCTNKMLVLR